MTARADGISDGVRDLGEACEGAESRVGVSHRHRLGLLVAALTIRFSHVLEDEE